MMVDVTRKIRSNVLSVENITIFFLCKLVTWFKLNFRKITLLVGLCYKVSLGSL